MSLLDQFLQGLCKEVEIQQLVIENLELRVSTIASDLDVEDQGLLRANLKSLAEEYRVLYTAVRSYDQELDKAVIERQQFESRLEETQRKLAALEAEAADYEFLPLESSATEKMADKFKALKQSISEFENTELTEFKRQLTNMGKSGALKTKKIPKSELHTISEGEILLVFSPDWLIV